LSELDINLSKYYSFGSAAALLALLLMFRCSYIDSIWLILVYGIYNYSGKWISWEYDIILLFMLCLDHRRPGRGNEEHWRALHCGYSLTEALVDSVFFAAS
jgi:hypothetical protein